MITLEGILKYAQKGRDESLVKRVAWKIETATAGDRWLADGARLDAAAETESALREYAGLWVGIGSNYRKFTDYSGWMDIDQKRWLMALREDYLAEADAVQMPKPMWEIACEHEANQHLVAIGYQTLKELIPAVGLARADEEVMRSYIAGKGVGVLGSMARKAGRMFSQAKLSGP
jgi:hypothetical protein